MVARYEVYKDRKNAYHSVNTNRYTDRLRKIRALNYDLSRSGHDTFEVKHLPFCNISIIKKSK